jgi:hypothetical protein
MGRGMGPRAQTQVTGSPLPPDKVPPAAAQTAQKLSPPEAQERWPGRQSVGSTASLSTAARASGERDAPQPASTIEKPVAARRAATIGVMTHDPNPMKEDIR